MPVLLLYLACGPPSGNPTIRHSQADPSPTDTAVTVHTDTATPDTTAKTSSASPACPDDTVELDKVCMDRFEAPNQAGAHPLVMYTFDEASAWCQARAKRLCYDDEWEMACAGTAGWAYPYGETHAPGVCNDEEVWRTYSQSTLSQWPASTSSPEIESLTQLLTAASIDAPDAAEHVEWLYQAEGSGDNTGCVGASLVYDLTGNIEEWTRRRDGGSSADFEGNLKGRYWSESRTCQSNITTHGDGFRFYEIGFRCCVDPR